MKISIHTLSEYPTYDSAYWAVAECRGETVYFGLCTHEPGRTAGFFSFDLRTEKLTHLWDVAKVVQSADGASQHGKIHTPLLEGSDAKFYFGTHFAYPFGMPAEVDYEGGRLLSFDPATGDVADFGIPVQGDGIITCVLDRERMQAYTLSVPSGQLVRCDIATGSFHRIGQVPSQKSICRSLAIDSVGNVYGSYEDLGVFVYDRVKDRLELLDDLLPAADTPEWEGVYRRGVNNIARNLWRCVEYDTATNRLYGLMATTSSVFSMDCTTREVRSLPQFLPHEWSAFDNELYPTLSMTALDRKLFYAPAPGFFDYERSERMKGWSQLMNFDLATEKVGETVALVASDGRRVHGVAAATSGEGRLHLIGAVEALEEEATPPRLDIDGKPFHLGLITIEV